mmetsp:Transcript_29715/g.86602  ORF Transcript_29715/g.86602 Transcript_29715/m.86602 type:complete len:201 (-) Transcript_29715:969-1571(-)
MILMKRASNASNSCRSNSTRPASTTRPPGAACAIPPPWYPSTAAASRRRRPSCHLSVTTMVCEGSARTSPLGRYPSGSTSASWMIGPLSPARRSVWDGPTTKRMTCILTCTRRTREMAPPPPRTKMTRSLPKTVPKTRAKRQATRNTSSRTSAPSHGVSSCDRMGLSITSSRPTRRRHGRHSPRAFAGRTWPRGGRSRRN